MLEDIGGHLNLNLNLTLALFEKHNDDLNQGQVNLIMMEGHWYWIRNRFPIQVQVPRMAKGTQADSGTQVPTK